MSYKVRVSQSIGSDAIMIVVKHEGGLIHRSRITKDQWMADEVDGQFGQLELIAQAAADCCTELERQRAQPAQEQTAS